MLKPYSASSFCLPNKNRVGVAHGDGTNLEVVYTNFKSARTPLRTSKSARTLIPTNFYADELIRGEPQIEN